MQGFQQAIRREIPFPQTLANFPSNVLIFSPKRSRPLPQTLAGIVALCWESFPHDISIEHRKAPNENHIWWINEQQIHIKMNLQPHQVPPQVPPQVLVFLIFR